MAPSWPTDRQAPAKPSPCQVQPMDMQLACKQRQTDAVVHHVIVPSTLGIREQIAVAGTSQWAGCMRAGPQSRSAASGKWGIMPRAISQANHCITCVSHGPCSDVSGIADRTVHIPRTSHVGYALARGLFVCPPWWSGEGCVSWTQVFKQLQIRENLHWSVEASYVELYNESFRDLANPSMSPADISIFEQQ